MVFRKKFKKSSRGFFVKKSKSYRRANDNPFKAVIPAVLYGAGRASLVNLASPITSRLGFLGGYADEIVLGTAGYFMAKKGSGLIKDAGKAILIVESASLGSQIVNQVSGTMTSSSNWGMGI